MAATRLIALHKNKGKSVAACLKSRTDYVQNPDKMCIRDSFRGKTVVLATGADPRTLGVAGETELLGRGVACLLHTSPLDPAGQRHRRGGGSVGDAAGRCGGLLRRMAPGSAGIPSTCLLYTSQAAHHNTASIYPLAISR